MFWKIFFSFLFIIGNSAIFLRAENGACEVYFSPRDHVAERLIQLIDREQKSIKIAIYSISHAKIIRALENAHERGVHLEIVVDPTSVKTRTPLLRLVKKKVPIFVWDPPTSYVIRTGKTIKPIMHDKFSVFGDHLVWTGSFNFTYAAESHNEENVLTVEGTQIARKYLDHFQEMKVRGCRPFEEYVALRKNRGKIAH